MAAYVPFTSGYTHGSRSGEDLNHGVTGNLLTRAFTLGTAATATGTTSTTAQVMMGLAVAYTPILTGTTLLMINGDGYSGAIGDGGTVQLSYGTGTAPSNGGTLAGTQVGSVVKFVAATTAERAPFCVFACVQLTVGTAYWVDVAVEALTGSTATVENLTVLAMEM